MTRTFETGASRNSDEGKLDFEAFLSPKVLRIFAEYMHRHSILGDGLIREGDNWQKGIPVDVLMKSLWRHHFDAWCHHRKEATIESYQDALCGIIFNAMALLYEDSKEENR